MALALTTTALAADRVIVLPPGANPGGNYSPGILVGDTLYISGQGGEDAAGKIPASFDAEVRESQMAPDAAKPVIRSGGKSPPLLGFRGPPPGAGETVRSGSSGGGNEPEIQRSPLFAWFSAVHAQDRVGGCMAAHRPLVWFELRSNDRIWLNQAEAIPVVAARLKLSFPSFAIVLAGCSRMEDHNDQDELMVERDLALARSIESRMPKDIAVFNIVGCRTIEKLAWALAVDTFVSTVGTSLVAPYIVGQKIGIVHANSGLAEALWGPNRRRGRMTFPQEDEDGIIELHWPFIEQPRPLAAIAPSRVVDQDANAHMHVRNYYIDPQIIARTLTKILKRGRGSNS